VLVLVFSPAGPAPRFACAMRSCLRRKAASRCGWSGCKLQQAAQPAGKSVFRGCRFQR